LSGPGGSGIFRSWEPSALMIPVVIRLPSGVEAEIEMWAPSGDHRGQHWVPNGVIRRSLLPSAEAVKTVSSPNFPPARVNRIFPFNEVSATVGDDEADADAGLGAPVPVEDEPAPLAHPAVIRATTSADTDSIALRLLQGRTSALILRTPE
jgi:hypothetical protein